MRLLLINTNPAVSRLVNLSVEKLGYEIDEFKNDDFDLNATYDVTIIDSDSADKNSITLLKEGGDLGQIIYIGPRGSEKPDFADLLLQKPFLPTDFVDIIKKLDTSKAPEETPDIQKENVLDDDIEGDVALDLDELDSLDIPMPDDIQEENIDADEEAKPIEFEKEDEESELIEHQNDELRDEDEDTSDEDNIEDDGKEEENSKDLSVSILDKEDINEVKQLLEDDKIEDDKIEDEIDENIQEENTSVLSEEKNDSKEKDIAENEVSIETEDEDKSKLSENLDFEEEKVQDNEELEKLDFIEEYEEEVSDLKLSVDEENDIEENIDDLELPNVEESKDNEPEALSEDFEESKDIAEERRKSSIEDLNEADFSDIFNDENETAKGLKEDENIEKSVEKIKDELEKSITQDVKKILDKDEIKDALKSLKINISISFDEV